MPSRLKEASKDVEAILKIDEKSRASDKRLLLAVWRYKGLVLTHEQMIKFMELNPAESYTRARRNLQKQGKYLPPEQITRERHEQAEQMKQEVINWHD